MTRGSLTVLGASLVCLACAVGSQRIQETAVQPSTDWPGVFAISPSNDTVVAWPTGICYDPPRTPGSGLGAAVMCEHLDFDQQIEESAREAKESEIWKVGFSSQPDSMTVFLTDAVARVEVPLAADRFRVQDAVGAQRYGVCAYWETSNGCFEFLLRVSGD